jgi:hypothetical protein
MMRCLRDKAQLMVFGTARLESRRRRNTSEEGTGCIHSVLADALEPRERGVGGDSDGSKIDVECSGRVISCWLT